MFDALGGGLVVFALDRGAKAAAFAREGAQRRRRRAPGALFAIEPVRNRAPWAWRGGSPTAWIAAFAAALAAGWAAAALGVLEHPLARIGLAAALGGALGNLYDRLRHGAVQDYVRCSFAVRGRRFASTFNLADVAIVAGLLCVALSCVVESPAAVIRD